MAAFQEIFFKALQQSIKKHQLLPIIETLIEVLAQNDIIVHRVQLPMNEYFGFRHPQYRALITTWEEGTLDEAYIPHSVEDAMAQFQRVMENSPYKAVMLEGEDFFHWRLVDSNPFQILDGLKRSGYTDYFNFGIPLPQGQTQICSLATKLPEGFPDRLETLILDLRYLVSFTIYGYYQSFVSHSIAQTYLGSNTGTNVLAGKMFRGKQDTLEAGILFCDIRGFTQMSEQLGGEKIISVVNSVFQIVGDEIEVFGGEILKFIGDALLIIFPQKSERSKEELCKQMITVAKNARDRVQKLAEELSLPVGIGFGGHFGTVQYGNIGTQNRLDFTVMGPAVNLTSRLESMCKSLDAYLTLSSFISAGLESELDFLGEHSLKGVEGMISIWGLRN